jgi:hypothetical protein
MDLESRGGLYGAKILFLRSRNIAKNTSNLEVSLGTFNNSKVNTTAT